GLRGSSTRRMRFASRDCSATICSTPASAPRRFVRADFFSTGLSWATATGRLTCAAVEPLSRRLECEGQRLAWNARHERADYPAEAERNPSRERDRLTVNIESAVAGEQTPV